MNVDELVAYTVAKPRKSAKRYFAHANHLYSVAAVTDASGQVAERYSYDAYGKRGIVGSSSGVSSVGNGRGFTGFNFENEMGWYYARSRMYSPIYGRFSNRNPWGYNHRVLQFYDYLSDDPANGTEPYSWEFLQGSVDFVRGGSDSLTFGGSLYLRNLIWGEDGQPIYETAYYVGEGVEVTAEIAMTGGSAYAKYAARKVIAKKAAEILAKDAAKGGATKMTSKVAFEKAKSSLGNSLRSEARSKFSGPGGPVHHNQPLIGHPQGGGTLFPTIGLPRGITNSTWNLTRADDVAAHMAMHARLIVEEKIAVALVNPAMTSLRVVRDVAIGPSGAPITLSAPDSISGESILDGSFQVDVSIERKCK